MLESLFGIRYTGSVEGTVYGYTLTSTARGTVATVGTLRPSGAPKYLGQVVVPSFGHAATVRAYVEGVI